MYSFEICRMYEGTSSTQRKTSTRDEAKNGKRALLISFRNKYTPIESSCFNYSFFIIMQVRYCPGLREGQSLVLCGCDQVVIPYYLHYLWGHGFLRKSLMPLLEVGHFASLWEGVSINSCRCDPSTVLLVPLPVLSGVRLPTFSTERDQV